MKKIYKSPCILIVETNVQQMLCGSTFTQSGDDLKVNIGNDEGYFGEDNTINVNSFNWDMDF